jgi:peptidoglycan/LPS O-acetylase OafA/YrhL
MSQEAASAPTPAASGGRHVGDGERLHFLDALRGLAAVYVVCYHMLLIPDPHLAAPRWAERFALAGGTGVTLFFIVSAFSLCYTMPLRQHNANPLRSFYLHRLFRIAPLFYVLIAVTLVRDLWLFASSHSLSEIALSATFLFNLVPGRQEGFVWASWTIGVEMVFYAMFPFIHARTRTLSDAVSLFVICLLAWLAIQLMLDYVLLPEVLKDSVRQRSVFRHLPIFALGMLLHHAFAHGLGASAVAVTQRSTGRALTWMGIFVFTALLQGWLPAVFGDSYYWQGIAYALLFLGLSLAPWRMLVNRTTRYLGKISYSIYLNHPTIVLLLAPVYHALYRNAPSLSVAFLASFAVTLSVVLPISALTYRWIEVPGIALGKRVAAGIKRRSGFAPDATA